MKLAAKLISAVLLGVIILLGIDGYLAVQREVALFEADMRRDAQMMGRILRGVVEHTWRTQGQERAMHVIADADKQEPLLSITWVWLGTEGGSPSWLRVIGEKIRGLLDGQEVTVIGEDSEGNRHLYTYIPVLINGERPGALQLSESLFPLAEYERRAVLRTLALGGALVVLGGFSLVLLGVGMIGWPLNRLIDKTRRVGAGDLSKPLRVEGRDEIGQLATALNTMCEQLAASQEKVLAEQAARIRALEQARHADRLRTVGRIGSGVAHELGTPLNVISGRAAMIASGTLSEADAAQNATIIRTQCTRMTTIIRQLLDFVRRRPLEKAPVDIRQIIDRTLTLLTSYAEQRKATVQVECEESPLTADVDATQIQQVLTNVTVNALQAIPEGGRVRVRLRSECRRPQEDPGGSDRRYVCISVLDEGVGISKEDMQHVFEPFFTTKAAGEGTGLGLSIALGIVREHGGWIDVSSKRGEGSCFTIYLPQEGDGCRVESS